MRKGLNISEKKEEKEENRAIVDGVDLAEKIITELFPAIAVGYLLRQTDKQDFGIRKKI